MDKSCVNFQFSNIITVEQEKKKTVHKLEQSLPFNTVTVINLKKKKNILDILKNNKILLYFINTFDDYIF